MSVFRPRRAAFFFLAFVLSVKAVGADLDPLSSGRVREIFELQKNAVVRVESSDQHGAISGTGFYNDPSGTIYTLATVIGDGKNVTVSQGMRKMPARVLVSDPRSGIAIIKVESTTPFIPIGNSSEVQPAMPVIAVGYPLDMPVAPSLGIVAGLDRKFLGYYFATTHVRVNLPVQHGFGGAPVLNLRGEVVGIVVSSVDGGAGCYMLPINAAEKVRMEYVRFGELRPGWIGVNVTEDSSLGAPSTARVAELLPNTPAARSGLQEGDVLLQVGDFKISAPEDVLDASFFLSAGDNIVIRVLRDGGEVSLPVRSTEHPMARNSKRDELSLPRVEFHLDKN